MSRKIIFENEYCGFESVYDLGRDIDEMWDHRYHSHMKDFPSEFSGTVKVTVEYIGDDWNPAASEGEKGE